MHGFTSKQIPFPILSSMMYMNTVVNTEQTFTYMLI